MEKGKYCILTEIYIKGLFLGIKNKEGDFIDIVTKTDQ